MTHTIRLRGGWTSTTDGRRTIHARNFGRPRTLDADERVWLVCQHVPGCGEIRVNGESLGGPSGLGVFAADLSDKLQERNRLELAVESNEPLGEVVLEIRSPPG